VEGFVRYMEKSSCCLINTRLYYNSVRLDMVTVQSLMEISHIKILTKIESGCEIQGKVYFVSYVN
jgi:hypothetical protein